MLEQSEGTGFGHHASAYQQTRPGYPPSVYQAFERLASPPPGGAVLEIGAGTGQATAGLLARGYRVLAVEPDHELAARAQNQLQEFGDRVEVRLTRFEDLPVEPSSFDLVVAATSLALDPARTWSPPRRTGAPTLGLVVPAVERAY